MSSRIFSFSDSANSGFQGLESLEPRLLMSATYTDALTLLNLDDLNADPRFDQLDGTGRGIAIIDMALDLDHPAFGVDADSDGVADRIKRYDDSRLSHLTPSSYGIDHGTSLTSIIASEDSVNLGLAPEADIYFFRASGRDSYNQSFTNWAAVEDALQWVEGNGAANGIDVVLLNTEPFFGHFEHDDTLPTNLSEYNRIKDELQRLAAADVTVVTPTGDYWGDSGYLDPGVDLLAADPNTIAAAAVFPSFSMTPVTVLGETAYATVPDQVTPYTMRAEQMVDVMAPGSQVTAAVAGGGYGSVDGTAVAAAHAAGGILLMNQFAHEEMGRSLHLWEVRDLLADSNHPVVDGDNEYDTAYHTGDTFGRLDLHEMAVTLDDRVAPPPTSVTLVSAADSDSGISQTDKLTNRNNAYDDIEGIDRRARFTVTGVQALAMVRLYYNGEEIGFARAGAGGSVVVRTNGDDEVIMADGVANIVATQEFSNAELDSLSYESGYSAAETINIDATPPALPIRPDLIAASDTGWNAYDDITADTTPTFDFSLSDVNYWEFRRDDVLISGTYMTGTSWTAPTQAEGVYDYVLRSLDEAGNYTDSPVLAVRIDTSSAVITAIESAGSLLHGSTRTTPVDTVTVTFDEAVYGFDVGDGYDPLNDPSPANPGEVMLAKYNTATSAWDSITGLASGGVSASPLETAPGVFDYSVWAIEGLDAFTSDATQYMLVLTYTLPNELDVVDDAGNLWTNQSGALWTQS